MAVQNMMQNQPMTYNWNQPTMYNAPQTQMMSPNYQMGMQNVNQQRPQIGYIPGRTVSSPDEVQSYEVLMDSPINVFPKNDRKEIYVKYWGPNGGIETDVYRLVEKDESAEQTTSGNSQVPQEWIEMKKQLDRIEKMMKYKKPQYGKKPKEESK